MEELSSKAYNLFSVSKGMTEKDLLSLHFFTKWSSEKTKHTCGRNKIINNGRGWFAIKILGYIFQVVFFLTNRLPSQTLDNLNPFQLLFHRNPNYTLLKIFGSLCYQFLRPYNFNKLELRSQPYVFLGYIIHYIGY